MPRLLVRQWLAAERVRAALGATLGVLFAAAVSLWAGRDAAVWLVAPVGASAVLVFTSPAGPLAQPWPVVAGNTLSALVGVLCACWVPHVLWAAALAVGLAILLMMWLRCLHPPGGAVALLMVLMHEQSLGFVLFPVMTNSVLLVLAGMLYNSLTGHPYPHRTVAQPDPPTEKGVRVTRQDVQQALKDYPEVLDVASDELARVLRLAQGIAAERLWRSLVCRDIMSTDPVAVDTAMPLSEAWAIMQERQIKALPVIDPQRQVVGILTRGDVQRYDIRRNGKITSGAAPEVIVGMAMSPQVHVAHANSPVLELLSRFSAQGHHHLPVVDADKRLVGILTQTDLVRALGRVIKA